MKRSQIVKKKKLVKLLGKREGGHFYLSYFFIFFYQVDVDISYSHSHSSPLFLIYFIDNRQSNVDIY